MPRQWKVPGAHIACDVIIISATASRSNKLLKVLLYSEQQVILSGVTDSDGVFKIRDLPSGTYGLWVENWGTTTVRVVSLAEPTNNSKAFSWSLYLPENGCAVPGLRFE